MYHTIDTRYQDATECTMVLLPGLGFIDCGLLNSIWDGNKDPLPELAALVRSRCQKDLVHTHYGEQ